LQKNSIHSVLVPGAAAPAGINTIKALRLDNYDGKIIASDSNTMSAGFFMADASEVIPEADNELFLKRLIEIIEKHGIKVLMPSSGYDIYPYSMNKELLMGLGTVPVVSDPGTLEVCRDKFLTFKQLSTKFDLPLTTLEPDKIRTFPVIAKPRFGKGSKGVLRIDDESDLKFLISKGEDLIYQEYLPGVEYTIDVLSTLEKKALLAVPRIRLQTKAGISTKGRIVIDKDIESICKSVAEDLKIMGPCCIQMKEAKDEALKLLEVNPRLGGGTMFTTLAGANFPSMILDMVAGNEPSIPIISEITIIRYFEEIVLYNQNAEKL